MRATQLFNSFLYGDDCPIIQGEEILDEVMIPLLPGNFNSEYEAMLEKGFWPASVTDEKTNSLVPAFSRLACLDCRQCVPARLNLSNYTLTDHQQSILSNSGLIFSFPETIDPEEHLALVKEYRLKNFRKSDPFHVENDWKFRMRNNQLMEARDSSGRLMAGCFYHNIGRSGIGDQYYYATERPEETKRMSFILISALALHMKERGNIDYLYLENWSRVPSKLSHKIRHNAVELLGEGKWRPVTRAERHTAITNYFKSKHEPG